MMKYLAGVLTVIAVGVLLVAYGLLAPRATASFNPETYYPAQYQYAPGTAGTLAPTYPGATVNGSVPPNMVRAIPIVLTQPASNVDGVSVANPAPRRATRRVIERAPRRDWQKTALIVGGSSATGAGLGALFGGKKGALIGAAIGGGASALVETQRAR
jgi:hypothetical protein